MIEFNPHNFRFQINPKKYPSSLPPSVFRWRMKGNCFYCGRELFRLGCRDERPFKYTRDHVQPRKWGSKRHNKCTVSCCYDCNKKKRDMDVILFVYKFLPHRVGKINWGSIHYARPKVPTGRGDGTP